jgi:predicted component of type VI protein secretion system
MLAVVMKRAIVDLVNNFEPRVQLLNVDVYVAEDSNAIRVTIEFKIINTERPISFDIALERTR